MILLQEIIESSFMPLQQRLAIALIIQDQAGNWIGRKAALEQAGFQVMDAKNYSDASIYLRDTSTGIGLLVTSSDFSVPQLELAADAVEQHGVPVIMTVDAGYPIGIHGEVALLLEPVSDAELVSAARTLLADRKPG
jgi:hypothetical protein